MLLSSPVFTGLLVVGTFASQTLAFRGSTRAIRKPDFCPSSCTSYDPSEWFAYPSISRVGLCNESMILDFNIHNDLSDPDRHSTIYACKAGELNQLQDSTVRIAAAQTKNSSVNYQLAGWAASTNDSAKEPSAALLTDVKSYLTGNIRKSEIFAYSDGITIGVHVGNALQLVKNIDLAIGKLASFIESASYDSTVFQFCGSDSNHTIGVTLSTSGDISTVQDHVLSWRNGECVSGAAKNISASGDLWSYQSASSSSHSNSTLSVRSPVRSRVQHASRDLQSHTSTHHQSHTSTHHRRSTCDYVTVVSGDSCSTLVTECGITSTEFYEYNTASDLCSTLAVGQTVCCSSGDEPDLSPSAYDNGTCYTYYVQASDNCYDLASNYYLTTAEINSYNNDTWGWFGCGDLQAGQSMCLSTGNPPYPVSIANAECGPQVANTTFTSDDSHTWSELNPCPLNACCDSYGQCGTTPLYCDGFDESTSDPPGTGNCIASCGSTITNWAVEPSSYSKVGYYEASSINRTCLQMDALSIDTSQWTHINFAFGNIDSDFSINVDGMEDEFEHFMELTDVKRLISFGGWDFSTSTDTYMIFRDGVNAENRATFAQNVAAYVEETGLDGVDFDWEYPSEPDIEGIPAGNDDEADNYLEFLKEVKDALPSGTLLSVTLPSSYWYLKPFPVSNMSDVVDYFNYMTYDMHGTWDAGSAYADWGCDSGNCLFSHVNMTETLWALAMLTKAGVATNQIMVGVSSYGRSFEMTTAGCYDSSCTWDAAGDAGECTGTAGYISNAEMNEILSTNSDSKVYSTNVTDILVYNSTQWVGYMTNATKVERQAYYETYNFGGTAEWAIDLEEFVSYVSSAAGAVETGGQTITIDPEVWTASPAAVTCAPPCYMIMPPKSLSTTTTITFPQWNTQMVWRATATKTTTFKDGSILTYDSYQSYTIPTSISISPGNLSPSYRFRQLGMLILCIKLKQITSTFGINKSHLVRQPSIRPALWSPLHSQSLSLRVIFCWGCPFCPPGFGTSIDSEGGSSSGDSGSDGDSDSSTTESESSSTSSSTSSGETYITAAGAAGTIYADSFPTTLDPTATVASVASNVKAQLSSNYAAVQSSLTAGVYASVYSTAAPICLEEQDPDSGAVGSWCTCSGSEEKFATLTGTSACGYTLMPTATSDYATSTVITTVIVETITTTSTSSSTLGRFDLAAESKLLYEPIAAEHTFYDLNWITATVTDVDPCSAGYGTNIASATPTSITWTAMPNSLSFDATFTFGGETYSECVYTNAAAPSSDGDGGTLSCSGTQLSCTTFSGYGVNYCDEDNTKILPLVSCPVTTAASVVSTYTTTETSKYTSY
ncbi:hypothetical protein N7490_000296 [Penicillium lividum]|nr:hypothetical protein N7490_000296 [Penicillium lividum]